MSHYLGGWMGYIGVGLFVTPVVFTILFLWFAFKKIWVMEWNLDPGWWDKKVKDMNDSEKESFTWFIVLILIVSIATYTWATGNPYHNEDLFGPRANEIITEKVGSDND